MTEFAVKLARAGNARGQANDEKAAAAADKRWGDVGGRNLPSAVFFHHGSERRKS